MAKLIYTSITSLDGYDVMAFWEHEENLPDRSPVNMDYGEIWQAADKIVYSRTLESPPSARTRIERDFDSEAVRRMKAQAGGDLSIGGPELAAEAIRAGLVDEIRLLVKPIVVGGGNAALPDHVRVSLERLDDRRFGSGVVYLRYRTRS